MLAYFPAKLIKKIFILFLGLFAIACIPQKKQQETYLVGRIKTQQGEIWIWLYDETPCHKESFVQLATDGYWDSLTFNRVVPGFVIQGGCPDTPQGFTDSHYLLAPERHDSLLHTYGAVGAGRDDNPNQYSARCQFYIVQNKAGIPRLDGNYTIFGHVFKGMDVVDAIADVPSDSLDSPKKTIALDIDIVVVTRQKLTELGFKEYKASKIPY